MIAIVCPDAMVHGMRMRMYMCFRLRTCTVTYVYLCIYHVYSASAS